MLNDLKEEFDMKKIIGEYYITYKDGNEFITEDLEEAEKVFGESEKDNVKQYFYKEWEKIWNGVEWEFEEGFVEVYFNGF